MGDIYDNEDVLCFVGGGDLGDVGGPAGGVVAKSYWDAQVAANGTRATMEKILPGGVSICNYGPLDPKVFTDVGAGGTITGDAGDWAGVEAGMCAYVTGTDLTTGWYKITEVSSTLLTFAEIDATGDNVDTTVAVGGSFAVDTGTAYDVMFASIDGTAGYSVDIYYSFEETTGETIDVTGGVLADNTHVRLHGFKVTPGDMGFCDSAVELEGDVPILCRGGSGDAHKSLNSLTAYMRNPNAYWVTIDGDGGAYHQWTLDGDDNVSIEGAHCTNVADGTHDLFSVANTPTGIHWSHCIFSVAQNAIANGNVFAALMDECYIDDTILNNSILTLLASVVTNSIVKIPAGKYGLQAGYETSVHNCVFINGSYGIILGTYGAFITKCTFIDQTVANIYVNSATAAPTINSNIFVTGGVTVPAVLIINGSIGDCNWNVAFCAAGAFEVDPFYDDQTSLSIAGPNDQIDVDPQLANPVLGDYRVKNRELLTAGKPDIYGNQGAVGAEIGGRPLRHLPWRRWWPPNR